MTLCAPVLVLERGRPIAGAGLPGLFRTDSRFLAAYWGTDRIGRKP